MLQKIIIDGLAMILDRLDGPFHVDGIPQHNGGRHQIETGGTVALVFKTAIAHLAEAVEKHGPSERVAGLALVQSGMDTAAATRRFAANPK